MTLHVVAHFHVTDGSADEVERHLAPLVEPTSMEDGCLAYRYYRDNEDANHFVFIEEWRDDDSLDVHLEAGHVLGMLAAVEPLLERPIEGFRLTVR